MLASVACRRDEIISGVSDSAFVGAMAELRRVQNDMSLDSARRKMARDSVLQGRGLTPDEMERAARALGRDPNRAAAIWQAIELRVNEPRPMPATIPVQPPPIQSPAPQRR
jgi:hypothetical protein